MSATYLDTMHDHIRFLREISDDLRELASAFGRVGNADVARELGEYADALMEQRQAVNAAVGEELSDNLEASRALTGSLLTAAIRGCFTAPSA